MCVQVQRAAEEVKENLDANNPNTKFCFIQEEQSTPHQGGVGLGERKATMNILNPDSGIGKEGEIGDSYHIRTHTTLLPLSLQSTAPSLSTSQH